MNSRSPRLLLFLLSLMGDSRDVNESIEKFLAGNSDPSVFEKI